MIHDPGRMEKDDERFHHTTQKGHSAKLVNDVFLEFAT